MPAPSAPAQRRTRARAKPKRPSPGTARVVKASSKKTRRRQTAGRTQAAYGSGRIIFLVAEMGRGPATSGPKELLMKPLPPALPRGSLSPFIRERSGKVGHARDRARVWRQERRPRRAQSHAARACRTRGEIDRLRKRLHNPGTLPPVRLPRRHRPRCRRRFGGAADRMGRGRPRRAAGDPHRHAAPAAPRPSRRRRRPRRRASRRAAKRKPPHAS